MTVAGWVSSASVVVTLILLAVVAVDRNRLKQRLHNAEGRVTGLGLDLEAMAERVTQLQSYLNTHESWATDATAPAALADTTRVDRWTADVAEPVDRPSPAHGSEQEVPSDGPVGARVRPDEPLV